MRKGAVKRIKIALVGLLFGKLIISIVFFENQLNWLSVFRLGPSVIAQAETGEGTEDVRNTPDGAEAPIEEIDAGTPAEPDTTSSVEVVLMGLEAKRREIQDAEKRLEEEKRQLEVLKQELEEKVDELTKIHQEIDEKLKRIERKETQDERKRREQEEANIKQLVKVYSSMKPKNVGPIIDRLDIDVALKVFKRMKSDQAAKILTYTNKKRAVTISEQLAEEKRKPK